MLAVLDQHCHPDTIANAFSTLMSLFNDMQGPIGAPPQVSFSV
jgi:hypothetical protein